MSKSSELDQVVKSYLMECIVDEMEPPMNNLEVINHCQERFHSECGWNVQRIGRVKAVEEWLRGLPTNIAYWNGEILELAVKWGSLPENATEKQEEKITENYWHFMAIKLCQLFDGYRVPEEV